MSQPPPKYLLQFFRWFCHPDYVEDIEGDLIERYERNVDLLGENKANWQFSWMVLSLFRPSLMRNFENPLLQNIPYMFQHNFKISIRTLWRDRSFSLINIGGLALGYYFYRSLIVSLNLSKSHFIVRLNHQPITS